MSDHEFFKDFGYKPLKRNIITYMPEEMQYNLFIMEIYNNWDFVKELMLSHKNGTLTNRKLDGLDQMWINTLLQNSIDVLSYDNSDEFYEKFIK